MTTTSTKSNITLTIESSRARQYQFGPRRQAEMDSPQGRTRVFIEWPGYSVMENLQNRHNRPHMLIKQQLSHLLQASGLTFSKISWSKFAGCSMCACSGGFILEDANVRGMDMWVKMSVAE